MIGLPVSTEINKQLPKTAIFTKFDIKTSQKKSFDEDISRLNIANVVSTTTIPSLTKGENIENIYFIEITLKRKEYNPKNILLLNKCIPQKMVFILRYEDEVQLAIFHTKLFIGSWKKIEEYNLELTGFNIDRIWENIVTNIGNISIHNGNTLIEQINEDSEIDKINKRLEVLEKKSRTEKQPRKQLDMFEEIKELKKKLEIYHG